MIREIASWVKLVASPQPAVNRLQIPQAAAMIQTRLKRSDSHATGIPNVV